MTSPASNHTTARLEQQGPGRYVLSGDLNFHTVPDVWQQGKALFGQGTSVAVDLSGVGHCNSAGLALLIEWMRNAQTGNQSISFQNLPPQMRDIATVCGVADKLPV
jgi:phospholipid transport system transporter-binding protein